MRYQEYVLPLLKGGDSSCLDNYRPISKLPILAKVLETLVVDQLKDYLVSNHILSDVQSGFRRQHSTTTAAVKVINDIIEAMDSKNTFVALFIDLAKAFDTVDHCIQLEKLKNFVFSDHTVDWFTNYLADRTQCVYFDNSKSETLSVSCGVPQESVLGPILFTIYINNLGDGISQVHFHFYADDTVIYCEAATLHQAFSYLQSAFNLVQIQLYQLKLVLNVEKTKIMLYSKSKKSLDSFPSIFTIHGEQIKQVKLYKYLGILIDDQLSFKFHINKLVQKLKLKIGFYFRNKACFSWKTRRRLVAATFLPALDYGDLLYRNAPDKCLSLLDTVYHNALRFVTGCKASVHHCTLALIVSEEAYTLAYFYL